MTRREAMARLDELAKWLDDVPAITRDKAEVDSACHHGARQLRRCLADLEAHLASAGGWSC